MRARKCKRGRGGCGRLCGRWVLAGASFGPMAAISRRGQGGRIYNNTRVRELLRRKCVKPADLTTHSPPKTSAPPPAQRHALAEALRSPTQRHALPEHLRSPTQPRRTPAGCAMHSPPTAQPFPRSATLPLLPFRFGHKKTAPHSACAMPNVSVDRRCGRSFGLVSRALFAAVAGRWRVGVGLRPQPWALRSRRCGRVLRA